MSATDLDHLSDQAREASLDERIQALVEPLQRERENLVAQKTHLKEEVALRVKGLDEGIVKLDRLLRAVGVTKAQPETKQRKTTRPNVKEDKLAAVEQIVLEAEVAMTATEIAAKVEQKGLDFGRSTVDNALPLLRDQERVRLAGTASGPGGAKLYAAPLRVVGHAQS